MWATGQPREAEPQQEQPTQMWVHLPGRDDRRRRRMRVRAMRRTPPSLRLVHAELLALGSTMLHTSHCAPPHVALLLRQLHRELRSATRKGAAVISHGIRLQHRSPPSTTPCPPALAREGSASVLRGLDPWQHRAEAEVRSCPLLVRIGFLSTVNLWLREPAEVASGMQHAMEEEIAVRGEVRRSRCASSHRRPLLSRGGHMGVVDLWHREAAEVRTGMLLAARQTVVLQREARRAAAAAQRVVEQRA